MQWANFTYRELEMIKYDDNGSQCFKAFCAHQKAALIIDTT